MTTSTPFTLVVSFLLLWPAILCQNVNSTCKCVPGDLCWPSIDEWSAFNRTINGSLIASVPPAISCYPGQQFDATRCNQTLKSWFDSNWHAANPVSIDYPQWTNNSCNPIFPNGTSLTGDTAAGSRGCTLGAYPDFVVNATNIEAIIAAVKWSASKNIRLVVKNTGHSFAGRSIGYGSLSIWTHNMHGFQFNDDWKPDGCPSANATRKQMAATIAAGLQDRDVYALSHEHGAVVSCGSNPSVGVMGWFPGGGHGPLSSSYGMGADNLLQARVVLPNGELVTANECQHTDLFWALRGGGSGTFGVIVEATMKAYPTPKTSIVSFTVTQTGNNVANATSQWWILNAKIHAKLPMIKDGGGQGYYTQFAPPIAPIFGMSMFTYHYDSTNETLDSIWKPMLELLDENKDIVNYTYQVYTAPTFFDIWNVSTGQAFEAVATGGFWMASRLLTRRALAQDTDIVARALEKAGPYIIGHMIANEQNRGLDIALNPAWRDTIAHLVVIEGYKDSDPPESKQLAKYYNLNVQAHALKQLSPESGAYFNEANPYEPDWQYTFFGPNYPRLRRVKEKYDPQGVFWCLSCVGSENWVESADNRLCRPSWW